MTDLLFWAPVMCAGAIAGASNGMLGVYIVGMRVPFLGICVAHAALAGAVFGALVGLTGNMLMAPALAGAIGMGLLVGCIDPQTARADVNVLLAILFSLSMGLAFLGLGLFSVCGVSDNEVRNLLWGSLAFCRWRDVWIMAIGAVVELVFLGVFFKEMRAILFSRTHAAAAGIHVAVVWTLFLLVTSVVLTVNFQAVGGLMIYSLLTNPAAAASQLVRGCGRTVVVAGILGMVSGLGGFLLSAVTDLPTGAMIVILSSLLVAAALVWSRLVRPM